MTLGSTPHASGLFRISKTGAPIQQLLADARFIREPAWSPHGDRIAWLNARGALRVWLVDTTGANSRPLVAATSGASWVSDGSGIALCAPTRTGTRVFIYDLSTGRARQVTF